MGIEAGVSEGAWVVVDLVDSMYIQMYIAFIYAFLCYRLEIILLLEQRFYLHDNDDSVCKL